MNFLPKSLSKIVVPPIKCQGIKTKLIPFIASNITWDGKGKWVEPFMGSGVVAFNLQPERALLADTNKHIVQFYRKIQNGTITSDSIVPVLEKMGKNLSKYGIEYYYEVRKRFNNEHNSFDFIFLNRSCFNGLMRFNSKGEYNVPFGHKPERFSPAYITKIANQVNRVSKILADKEWEFIVADWRETLDYVASRDFVYMDPPYIGRHADYYNVWSELDAVELSQKSTSLPCKFALSMWLENKYRKNSHIQQYWAKTHVKTFSHFYHVGSTENLRNEMIEALVLKGA